MKCQNCGSTDIVAIQGQNFCINCGQMVDGSAPVKAAKTPAKAVEPAPIPTETEPKAVPTPMPTAEPVAAAVETVPVVKIAHFGDAPKAVKSTVPSEPAKSSAGKVPHVVNPASKPNPAQVKAAATRSEAPVKPSRPAPNRPERLVDRTTNVVTPLSDAEADLSKLQESHAQPEDIRPHPFSFTLKLMGLIAVPVGLAIGAALWFRLDQDLLLYLSATAALVVFAVVIMAQTALQYGLSRVQDGRPAKRSQWWAAARGGFMDVVNVDLIGLIVMVLLGIAGFGLWQVAQLVSAEPQVLRWAVLAAGNAVLAWVLIGTLAARHIAIPAVVIGGLSATEATKLGWQTFNRAGGHLVVALAEVWLARLVIAAILAAAAVSVSSYLPQLSDEMIALAIGGGVMAAIMLVLWFSLRLESSLWLKQYRYWMSRYFPERRAQLLSGRIQSANRR
jgi:hypothetical protein